jgi:hypothetical protein
LQAKLQQLLPAVREAGPQRVTVLPTLAGDVDLELAVNTVYRLQRKLAAQKEAGSNSVLLVYLQGYEALSTSGHSLLLAREVERFRKGEEDVRAVSIERFAEVLAKTHGAQVWLLDVVRLQSSKLSDPIREDYIIHWPSRTGPSHVGVVRYARDDAASMPRLLADLAKVYEQAERLADGPISLGKQFSESARERSWLSRDGGKLRLNWVVPEVLGELRVRP